VTQQVARSTYTATINSGALLSSDVNIVGATFLGIIAPTITSGQLFLQVGQSSGTYVGRLHDPRSQAAWFWNAGPGSAAIVLDVPILPFTNLAIEAQNSQANLTEFSLVVARAK